MSNAAPACRGRLDAANKLLERHRDLLAHSLGCEQPDGLGSRRELGLAWPGVYPCEHLHDRRRHALGVSRLHLDRHGALHTLDRANLAGRYNRYASGQSLSDGQAKWLVLAGLQQDVAASQLRRYLSRRYVSGVLRVLGREVIQQLRVVRPQARVAEHPDANIHAPLKQQSRRRHNALDTLAHADPTEHQHGWWLS